LHLTVEYPPIIHGGLGTAVGGLVQASAAAGLDVHVLLVNDGAGAGYRPAAATGPVLQAEVEGEVPVVTTTWAAARQQATALIRAWRPDVLHLHVFWLWPLVAQLKADTGIPVVYTVHSLDRAEYEIGYGPAECLTQWDTQAATIHGADRVLALTRSEARLIEEYCPGTMGKIRIVGNGITLSETAASPQPRSSDPPVVLFSGRFVDRKGVRDLLQAIPAVLASAPQTRFVLAGGHRGCTSQEMDSWWRPGTLLDAAQVHFTGWLDADEMRDWYRRSHILVVPSWYEPFGMVVLEGMHHSLAIAAAAVGGPAEILKHEHTGLLFAPRDPHAIAGTLRRLITNPQLRSRIAAAGRADLARHWIWPKIIPLIQNVYSECAHTASEPA
jgi:glycogen(starch) synthase